jgi:tubulin-specific chaperone C
MEHLEQTLEQLRSVSVPKTKFAFKRKTSKPPLSATSTPSTSSRDAKVDGERDALPVTSTFHKLSSYSGCRLSFQSIPTFGAGSPSSDLTISDLDHCVVDLCGTTEAAPHNRNQLSLTSVHVRELRETILILPNVKGSVFLHNLHRCTVIVACQQASVSSFDVRVCSYLSDAVPHAQLNQRPRLRRFYL